MRLLAMLPPSALERRRRGLCECRLVAETLVRVWVERSRAPIDSPAFEVLDECAHRLDDWLDARGFRMTRGTA